MNYTSAKFQKLPLFDNSYLVLMLDFIEESAYGLMSRELVFCMILDFKQSADVENSDALERNISARF